MASEERIKQIEAYVSYWEGALARSQEQLAYLQKIKSLNAQITDQAGSEILDDRIFQEDYAVRQFQKGLLRAQHQLGLARSGHEV